MKRIVISNMAALLLFISPKLIGQCDTIANICEKHFTNEYISDGQEYRALLIDNQKAEFHSLFYGGSTYRFAACSGLTDGNLIFSLFDEEHNQLFTNANYMMAPYWDFQFSSTMHCTIEAQLEVEKLKSGCAVLLIGFRQ